jgi:hypothetical protein
MRVYSRYKAFPWRRSHLALTWQGIPAYQAHLVTNPVNYQYFKMFLQLHVLLEAFANF